MIATAWLGYISSISVHLSQCWLCLQSGIATLLGLYGVLRVVTLTATATQNTAKQLSLAITSVRLITTSDPIGPDRAKMGPHRTLSDHIGLKQHHIGRIGPNADRQRARN